MMVLWYMVEAMYRFTRGRKFTVKTKNGHSRMKYAFRLYLSNQKTPLGNIRYTRLLCVINENKSEREQFNRKKKHTLFSAPIIHVFLAMKHRRISRR